MGGSWTGSCLPGQKKLKKAVLICSYYMQVYNRSFLFPAQKSLLLTVLSATANVSFFRGEVLEVVRSATADVSSFRGEVVLSATADVSSFRGEVVLSATADVSSFRGEVVLSGACCLDSFAQSKEALYLLDVYLCTSWGTHFTFPKLCSFPTNGSIHDYPVRLCQKMFLSELCLFHNPTLVQ